ncbi:12460_t:CDS:2, partial [Acaulospora colombiana]
TSIFPANIGRIVEQFINLQSASTGKMEPDNTLKQLYEAILENALPDEGSLTLMRYVLQAVSLTFQPISIFTIERFSPADPENRSPSYVQILVDRLASVMKDGTIYLPIHTLHPSFQQFLKNQPPEAKFYLEPGHGHARLATACLDLLPNLKTGTWTHVVPLSKIPREWEPIPPKVLEEGPDMPLRYAVTFWAKHMCDALDNPHACDKLLRFFANGFLAWVEWASAIREIPEGMNALDWQLEKWCNDALNFLQTNQEVIERYPKQVHMSALFFTPTNSFIHKSYFIESQTTVPIIFNSPSIVQSTHRVLMSGVGKSGILACEFSLDGQRLWTLTVNGTIRLWRARDGTVIMDLEDPRCAPGFRCAQFSKNGSLIVSGGSLDHRVAIWDGVTGKLIRVFPREHQSVVKHVVFALEDGFIVSSFEDSTMRRWPNIDEPDSDQFKGAVHTRSVEGLIVSPNGVFVCSWSTDSLILWDAESPSSIRKWEEKGGFVAAIFSLDGRKLIGGDDSGKIHFWDTSTTDTIRIIEAHQGCVFSLAICADRTTLASGSLYENTLRLWNIHTGEELCSPLSTHTDDIVALAFNSFALVGHTDELTLIAVTPDGDKVVSSSGDATVRLWEMEELSYASSDLESFNFGTLAQVILLGTLLFVMTALFAPVTSPFNATYLQLDMKREANMTLAVGGDAVSIWKVDRNNLNGSELTWNLDILAIPNKIDFSPDEKYIAICMTNQELDVWNLEDGRLASKATAGRKSYDKHLIFSPDGKTIATGTMDGVDLYDFNVHTGLCLFASMRCANSRRIGFSDDGRQIYVDTYFADIYHLSREKLNYPFLRGRVKRGVSTPLPSFTFQTQWSHIVPMREREPGESGSFLALPTNINVEKWEAYGNQIALGLHDGSLMIEQQ